VCGCAERFTPRLETSPNRSCWREVLEVVDREKERLGRELHDGLCQTLAGIAIITAIAATLFSVGVSAADLYHGIDRGNADLSAQRASAEDFVGVQPSVGDSVNRYQRAGPTVTRICSSPTVAARTAPVATLTSTAALQETRTFNSKRVDDTRAGMDPPPSVK